MDRGTYFHSLYRLENRLGRVFAEVLPYPLYPLDEYFGGTVLRADRKEARTVTELIGFELPQELPLSA